VTPRSPKPLDRARPLLRGICLVVKGDRAGHDRRELRPAAAGTITKFPRWPDSGAFSGSIPLFFIGRNKRGVWVAREAEGRTGGLFLLRRSALRFAEKHSAPLGCATMLLAGRFELDVDNRGNRLVAWLEVVRGIAAGLIPDCPPPIAIGRKNSKIGEWR
jgi:hypothetical protein